MTAHAPTAYDLVEYPNQWYPQTHPDRLATIATLHGLDPTPPQRARVLELGCGAGWNLLHMAAGLPEGTFVGVDLAARPIDRARDYAQELGVSNATFHALDLADVDAGFGRFDYVIAHGVYSWVPAPVRDRLMAVAGELLSPQGVAYISYATYPGRYLTRVMREMMRYYARRFDEPAEQARHARALLGFLRDAQPGEGSYSRLLDDEMERIRAFPDQFLYHDDLSEVNEPCYFHEFAAHAAEHGLQYLSEANFHETKEHQLTAETRQAWQNLSRDIVEYEQFRDFIVFRRFRQTLLCRRERDVQRRLQVEQMRRFFVAAPARRVSGGAAADEAGDGAPGEAVRYQGFAESYVDARTALTRAALDHLGQEWPQPVAFDDLVDAARRVAADDRASTAPREESRQADEAEVAGLLLELYGGHFLALNVRRPPLTTSVSERPEADPLARWQAASRPIVYSRVGLNVRVDAFERALLPLLDGTRDREQLRAALTATEHDFDLEGKTLEKRLDVALRTFAQEALLIA